MSINCSSIGLILSQTKIICKSVPLSVPVTAGSEDFTRILYQFPEIVPAGIAAEIVPAVVEVSLPISVSVVNVPFSSDKYAVKTLPLLNVPEIE